MRIPQSFDKLTVEQYQEIAPIYKKIGLEKDAQKIMTLWANIIAIVTDKQTDDIEDLPLWKLKAYITRMGWLNNPKSSAKIKKYLFIKGRLYKATGLENISEFNMAKYHEAMEFMSRSKGDAVKELHNLAATIYSPLTLTGFKHDGKNHAKHAAKFRKLKISRIYPTVFFYSNVWKNSIMDIQVYLANQNTQAMNLINQSLEAIQKEIFETDGVGM